jgi:pSer/pThr/pTyr-binding forkhead associated (FHA) protein/RNA polymerase subunit RPABC4/transcription elongation factor Spt4
MTAQDYLNLTSFVTTLDGLAEQVDDPSTGAVEIYEAVSSLCSSISATSLFPGALPDDPTCPWEGSFGDDNLCVYSATHQFVFSLMFNSLNSAVLSGAEGVTWKIARSEKGNHVIVVDAVGEVLQDIIIDESGSARDASDVSESFAQLKAEWDEISSRDEESLPAYIPEDIIPDSDLPDIDDLPDISGPDSDSGPEGGSGSSGAGGASVPSTGLDNAADDDFNSSFGEKPGGSSSGGLGDMLGSALKGAAAVGLAAGARAVAKAAADKLSGPSSRSERPDDSLAAKKASDGHEEGAKLLILQFSDGRKIEVSKFPFVLGRSADVDLTLDSRMVSRKHAQFIEKENEIHLEDLGSSNGTMINDKKLSGSGKVKANDEIRCADVVLTVISCPGSGSGAREELKTVAFNLAEKQKKSSETPPAPPPPPSPPPQPPKKAAETDKARPEKIVAKEKSCSKCSGKMSSDAKFCPHCGNQADAKSECAFCHAKIEKSAKFCPGCGKPVGAAPKPAAPKPAAPKPAQNKPETPKAPPPPPPPAPSQPVDYLDEEEIAAESRSVKEKLQARRDARRQDEDNEFARRVGSDDDAEGQKILPSVRWVSFLFAIFLLADHGRLIDLKGDSVIDEIAFQRGLGAGICTIFFAFIAGSSSGFSRLLTLVCAGVYVGNQLFRDYNLYMALFENPQIFEKNPEVFLPVVALLFGLWLLKRAARRS